MSKKFLKQELHPKGYMRVHLMGKGTKLVHRLVAFTYIPTVEGKTHINHKNSIRHDNRVENLEWCTLLENNRDAVARGTHPSVARRVMTPETVRLVRSMWPEHGTTELSRMFGVHQATLNDLVHGRTYLNVN